MISDAQLGQAMRRAIELASETAKGGHYPIGSVVVGPEGIIASAGSKLIAGHDPSAHPEMIAIREAASKTGSRYLPGTYLVSTLEPCPMCASAAIWAKMDGIAYAANQDDAIEMGNRLQGTQFTFRQIEIRCHDVIQAGQPKLRLVPELMRTEMKSVLDRFVGDIKVRGKGE